MSSEIETPDITAERNVDTGKLIADKAGMERRPIEKNNQEVIILAMPNVSEENAKKFMSMLALMSPYLPFNVAVVYERIAAISKDDILKWKSHIDEIITENKWN